MALVFLDINQLNNKVIGSFRLQHGQNKIGRDASQCNVQINYFWTEPVQFYIYLTNQNDAYIVHLSNNLDVFKTSSIPSVPDIQVKLKKGHPYEMIPGRYFFFGDYKFTLSVKKKNSQRDVQILPKECDKYSGTQILDDVQLENAERIKLEQDLYQSYETNTNQFQSTVVLDDIDTSQICYNFISPYKNQQDEDKGLSFEDVLLNCFDKIDKITQTNTDIDYNNDISKFKSQEELIQSKSSSNYFTKGFKNSSKLKLEQSIQLQLFNQNSCKEVPKLDIPLDKVYSSEQIEKNVQPMDIITNVMDREQIIPFQVKEDQQVSQQIHMSEEYQCFNDIFGDAPRKSYSQIIPKNSNKIQVQQITQQVGENSIKTSDPPISIQKPKKQNKFEKIQEKVIQKIVLKRMTDTLDDECMKTEENQKDTKHTKRLIKNEDEESNSWAPLNVIPSQSGQDLTNRNRKKLKQEIESNKPNFKKIAFSGFTELPTKTQLQQLGLELIEQKSDYFDILVMKECKRTMKFLIALTIGSKVVNESWIKASLRKKEQQAITDTYIPDSNEFEKQFKNSLQQLLVQRDTAMQSDEDGNVNIFKGYTFIVDTDVKPSKEDIQNLIHLGGGQCIESKPRRQMRALFWVVSETSIIENMKQNVQLIRADKILDAVMLSDLQRFIVL